MTLSGHNVKDLLESNTYSGLEAKLKFTMEKRYDKRNKSSKERRTNRKFEPR